MQINNNNNNNTPRMISYVDTPKWSRERATEYCVIHPLPIMYLKVRCI